jgi:hypothetical protein
LKIDYLFMASDNPVFAESRVIGPFWTGHNDAQMTMRTAYGAKGAYFYIEIEDSGAWTPFTSRETDAAEIFLDIIAKADMGPSQWINPTQWALTPHSLEFQIPFGGATLPQIFWRDFDPGAVGPGCLVNLNDPYRHYMNWKLVNIDATHKVVEWFLPWATWGLAGIPNAATKFCFEPGYNDVDDGVEADVKMLRWVNMCDPFCAPDLINWGEIQMGPSLP